MSQKYLMSQNQDTQTQILKRTGMKKKEDINITKTWTTYILKLEERLPP